MLELLSAGDRHSRPRRRLLLGKAEDAVSDHRLQDLVRASTNAVARPSEHELRSRVGSPFAGLVSAATLDGHEGDTIHVHQFMSVVSLSCPSAAA